MKFLLLEMEDRAIYETALTRLLDREPLVGQGEGYLPEQFEKQVQALGDTLSVLRVESANVEGLTGAIDKEHHPAGASALLGREMPASVPRKGDS